MAYKQKKHVTAKALPLSKLSFRVLFSIAVGALLVVGSSFTGLVSADRFQDQINQLQADNNASQSVLKELEAQSSSYEQVIAGLQSQIEGVQAQLDASQTEQTRLQDEITTKQAELEKQREVLGQSLKGMYVKGDISTVEMLATSKNLSDFVDGETYRAAVQSKIQKTVNEITKIQAQLKVQKDKIDQLIIAQQEQRRVLDSARAEQAGLLAMNQDQQNSYSQKIKDNKSQINELMRQQAVENARLFGGGGGSVGGGGYPWGDAPCMNGGHIKGYCYDYSWSYGSSWMNWQNNGKGYAYRNCTDWVAWRGGFSGGLGDAKNWINNAPRYGYTVSRTPVVGAAAVSTEGYYGHVMYVEAVNADGSIFISDYNRAGPGEYGTSTLSASTARSLWYVHP